MERTRPSILAIICAKKDSGRMEGKNRSLLPPVYKRLKESKIATKTVVATDDWALIADLSVKYKFMFPGEEDEDTLLQRSENASRPEDSVFNVAKYVYYTLRNPYDIIIVILPNVINFDPSFIKKGIEILEDNNLNEVRTYDESGVENGVIIMKKDWFLNGSLSVYCGAVITKAKEIHYKHELSE